MAVITIQKADISEELAVLSQVLETAKAKLKDCQDKIVFLTDENKVILQEKAMLQGKFKQLEDAL